MKKNLKEFLEEVYQKEEKVKQEVKNLIMIKIKLKKLCKIYKNLKNILDQLIWKECLKKMQKNYFKI